MRLETGTWLVLALGLVVAGAAHADGGGGDRLADTLDQQGQLIAEMRRELSDLRSAQLDRDDRIRALEDELANPLPQVGAGSQAVTADWVDRRIQAFETADESRFFLTCAGHAQGGHRYRTNADRPFAALPGCRVHAIGVGGGSCG